MRAIGSNLPQPQRGCDASGGGWRFPGGREDARVFTTKDVAAGYRVISFFHLKGMTCVLLWVMLEDL
jgi:hypothetical protein